MLRLTSFLSLLTWISLLVAGTIAALWPPGRSETVFFGVLILVSAVGASLSAIMLARNRPFGIGLSFFISLLGLLPGLYGIGLFVYCITVTFGSSRNGASGAQWFFAINNSIMLALPITWASLWRDYRHEIADQQLTPM